jgi:two-component system OmpR family sensor kinase
MNGVATQSGGFENTADTIPLNSLRTRIAMSYGALIVTVIVLAAIAIDDAFRQILLDQARLRINATTEQIVQSIDESRTVNVFEPVPASVALIDRANLDHWAGPLSFIQIDSLRGETEAKSTNMGALELSANTDFRSSDSHFDEVRTSDGRELLVLTQLLRSESVPIAIALVAEPLDNVRFVLAQASQILFWSAFGGAVLVGAVSFFIAGTAIDPIKRLTKAMTEIGSDQLNRRIPSTRTDELGRLATAFNAMLARLEEAFARERQFIADASHELKTPLTVINANAQLLKRWGDDEPEVRSESLDAIINESQQLAGMVSGMLTLAKADSGDQIPKEPVLIEYLINDVVTHARARAERKDLRLEMHLAQHGAVVIGDESLLRQLFNNLVDNAIKFTERGAIDVTLALQNGNAIVEVTDTGVGIEVETAERLFDRFFRSDASHSRIIEGTGLGLAIVRSIARIHGGTVTAAPRLGGGSVFRVMLPASATVIET